MIKKIAFVLISVAITTAFIAFTSKPKEDKLTLKTQEKEATVRMTVTEWSVVLNGVSQLPLKDAQGIYMKIVTQVNQQLTDSVKKK